MDLGKKFSLDQATLIIGRSSKCDIQVDQESVSRNHARIVRTGKSIAIRDLD
jgi:two-component system cell cycle response regulator